MQQLRERGARAAGASRSAATRAPRTARRSTSVARDCARRRADAHDEYGRRLRPLRRRAAPGGSTSESAREIVEQYSAAIHSASATRSPGTREPSSARKGSSSFCSAISLLSARPTTTPEHLAPAEGHDQHRADLHNTAAQLLRQPVVKWPAQRAGRRHRLNLGDRGTRGPISGGSTAATTMHRTRATRAGFAGPTSALTGVVGQAAAPSLTGRRRSAARRPCRSAPT